MVQPEARAFPRRGRVGRSVSKNVSRAEVTTRSCTEAFRAGRIRTSNRGVVPDLVGCSPGPAAISTLPMIWRGRCARSSFDVVSTAILSLWRQLRMRSCRKMSVGRGWLHHSDLIRLERGENRHGRQRGCLPRPDANQCSVLSASFPHGVGTRTRSEQTRGGTSVKHGLSSSKQGRSFRVEKCQPGGSGCTAVTEPPPTR